MLRATNLVAFLKKGRVWLNIVVYDVFYFVSIELQPRAHVFGDVIGVERASLHVSEDGLCAVIARHNDIATVVSGIENIVVGIIRGLRGAFSCGFKGRLS